MNFRTLALSYRFVLMAALIIVDLLMFKYLINGVTGEDQISAAVAGLIGTLIGAIATTISIGARDFFTTDNNIPS
jgi:uncharacterized membrane-anchored protein